MSDDDAAPDFDPPTWLLEAVRTAVEVYPPTAVAEIARDITVAIAHRFPLDAVLNGIMRALMSCGVSLTSSVGEAVGAALASAIFDVRKAVKN